MSEKRTRRLVVNRRDRSEDPRVQRYLQLTDSHHCTDGYLRHWTGLQYTTGVQAMAEILGAHWLVDVIASWQPKLARHVFQVWSVTAGDDGALITAWSDTPNASRMLARQRIPYTDFPADLMPFDHLWVESGVLILSCEH